jgi:hypothetical protein
MGLLQQLPSVSPLEAKKKQKKKKNLFKFTLLTTHHIQERQVLN